MKDNLLRALVLLALLGAGILAGTFGRQAIADHTAPQPVQSGDFSAVLAGQPSPVVLFTTPTCPWCQKARAFLDAHAIPYTDRDITQPEHAAAFEALGGGGVPVMFTTETRITGFSEEAYRLELLGR